MMPLPDTVACVARNKLHERSCQKRHNPALHLTVGLSVSIGAASFLEVGYYVLEAVPIEPTAGELDRYTSLVFHEQRF